MKGFIQTEIGIWESEQRVIDAAVIKRNDKGDCEKIVSSTSAKYTIVQEGQRFKIYETHLNRGRVWLKNVKTLSAAFKFLCD